MRSGRLNQAEASSDKRMENMQSKGNTQTTNGSNSVDKMDTFCNTIAAIDFDWHRNLRRLVITNKGNSLNQ